MTSPKQQLDRLASRERWSFLRWACFGLGVLALFAAFVALGFGSLSPKRASETFNAFVLAGFFRLYAWPLMVFGAGAISVGAVVSCALARKHSQG